jgi:integrase/recombinase XerD
VVYKQSLGMRFITESRSLKSFCTQLGDVEMDRIKSTQVCEWLAGSGSITRFYSRKLDVIRGFYRFALARGYSCGSPLPNSTPHAPTAFVPYIFSRDEIRRLLDATANRERCNLSSLTCRTLILLLYGTGLRIGEAIDLNFADVDLQEGILCIRDSKFYKTRLVPLGEDLKRVLSRYAAHHNRRPPFIPNAPFLLTQRGAPVARRRGIRLQAVM